MSSQCPKCNSPRDSEATECPACGIVYAKYRNIRPSLAITESSPSKSGKWIFIALLAFGALGLFGYKQYSNSLAALKARDAELRESARQKEEKILAQRKAAEVKQGVAKSVADLNSVFAKWNDAYRLADATSRIALSGPVSNLQAIKREATGITVPACLDAAKQSLLDGMGATIEGFMTFMANENNLGKIYAADFFDKSREHFKKYEGAVGSCPAEAP